MTADRVLHCTMQYPVHELYRCLSYLAASHPWTHPVMMAVAKKHQPLVDAFHVTYSPEFWEMPTPFSPPSGPTQWLFQGPPAESKFLAA